MKEARRRGPWIAWCLLAALGLAVIFDPFHVVAQVAGPFFAPNGSASQPSYTYSSSPRLGRYRIEVDREGFVADGVLIWHYAAGRLHLMSGVDLRVGGNAYTQGSLGVGTDNPTSRLHVVGSMAVTGATAFSGAVTIVNGTITGATITSGGNLLASPDNALDIGQSGATRYRDVFVARNLHVAGYSHLGGIVTYGVHSVTIASNGDGNGNAEILPGHAAAVLRVECLDAQGCMARFAEDGVAPGTLIRLVNVGAQSVFVLDHATAGTRQHVAGTFTAAKNQTMQLIFLPDTSGITSWYELSRSSN